LACLFRANRDFLAQSLELALIDSLVIGKVIAGKAVPEDRRAGTDKKWPTNGLAQA